MHSWKPGKSLSCSAYMASEAIIQWVDNHFAVSFIEDSYLLLAIVALCFSLLIVFHFGCETWYCYLYTVTVAIGRLPSCIDISDVRWFLYSQVIVVGGFNQEQERWMFFFRLSEITHRRDSRKNLQYHVLAKSCGGQYLKLGQPWLSSSDWKLLNFDCYSMIQQLHILVLIEF